MNDEKKQIQFKNFFENNKNNKLINNYLHKISFYDQNKKQSISLYKVIIWDQNNIIHNAFIKSIFDEMIADCTPFKEYISQIKYDSKDHDIFISIIMQIYHYSLAEIDPNIGGLYVVILEDNQNIKNKQLIGFSSIKLGDNNLMYMSGYIKDAYIHMGYGLNFGIDIIEYLFNKMDKTKLKKNNINDILVLTAKPKNNNTLCVVDKINKHYMRGGNKKNLFIIHESNNRQIYWTNQTIFQEIIANIANDITTMQQIEKKFLNILEKNKLQNFNQNSKL